MYLAGVKVSGRGYLAVGGSGGRWFQYESTGRKMGIGGREYLMHIDVMGRVPGTGVREDLVLNDGTPF